MKKTIYLLLIGFAFLACKEKTAQEPFAENSEITTSETENTQEWEILFDGTSLDHWRGYQKDSMPAGWRIENEAMAFVPGESHGNDILTKKTYTNFILSLEWKIAEGGNSGIFWGVQEDEAYPYIFQTGPEIQVLDDAKHPDSFVGEGTHKAGSLYDMIAPSDLSVVKPAGEWNLCVIEINHETNQGTVTLNGTKIVTFPVHGKEWDTMVANSKFKDWEGFGVSQTGHIGLQDHGDKVWFRNIKIKEL